MLVAVVQLTYSMEDSQGTLVTNGPVRIIMMDHYYPKNDSETIPSLGAEQSAAHTFGYISSSYKQGNASDFDQLRGQGVSELAEFISFNMVDHWAYLYFDSNPTTHATFYTSRTVNATWLCAGYDVVQGGDGSTVDIVYLDGGVRRPFFVGETGPGATTYMTETEEVCGPRCARVWAFQTEILQSEVKPSLYDCNVTVSQVSDMYLPEHSIPDLQARIAAGSIGLEGFQHRNTTRQWVRYRDKYVVCSTHASPHSSIHKISAIPSPLYVDSHH